MTRCNWMGIHLQSPIVLASLTLFSKPNIEKHCAFFKQAKDYGVGAIILPSINPTRATEEDGFQHVRTTTISTGLSSPCDYMGFAVLGTTDNVVSIEYGLELAKQSVDLDIPIIGSLANIGSEEVFLDTLRQLLSIKGLAGVELNFSCPAVKNGLVPSVSLLKRINEENIKKLPVTIKLSPQFPYDMFQGYECLFQGITLSNAYVGLVPPNVSLTNMSPFGDMECWRPTGVYGPQEKIFTFYDIWRFKTSPETKDIQLSSVGGFVSSADVIQALMLGTDSVQLSSAVFWGGLSIIQEVNEGLVFALNQNSMTVEQLKGISLNRIMDTDIDLPKIRPLRKMRINSEKCKKCIDCACIGRGCYAIIQVNRREIPWIDQELCSGCGWCKNICRFNAIDCINEASVH